MNDRVATCEATGLTGLTLFPVMKKEAQGFAQQVAGYAVTFRQYAYAVGLANGGTALGVAVATLPTPVLDDGWTVWVDCYIADARVTEAQLLKAAAGAAFQLGYRRVEPLATGQAVIAPKDDIPTPPRPELRTTARGRKGANWQRMMGGRNR